MPGFAGMTKTKAACPCFWPGRKHLLAQRRKFNGKMAPDSAAADRARRLLDRAESGASHGAWRERFRLCLPHLWRHSGLWRLQRARLGVRVATRAIDRASKLLPKVVLNVGDIGHPEL